MKWNGLIEKYGLKTEQVGEDPFAFLRNGAGHSKANDTPTARISTTVGTSTDYGAVKVSFTVSVECNQDEGSMNMAAESIYRKAVELTNDAASHVGLPQLPEME